MPMRGFTLIELLVASTCAGLVLAAALAGWQALAGTHARLDRGAVDLQALRAAQAWWDDDLARATAPVQDLPDGWRLRTRDAEGHPGTVTWAMAEELLRRTWQPLAGPADTQVWPPGVTLQVQPSPTWTSGGHQLPLALVTLRDVRDPTAARP